MLTKSERSEHESSWKEEDLTEGLKRQEELNRFNAEEIELPFIKNTQSMVAELGDHVLRLEKTSSDLQLQGYDPGERLYTEYHEAQDDTSVEVIDLEKILEQSIHLESEEDQEQRRDNGRGFLQVLRELFARFINLFRRARPTNLETKDGLLTANSEPKDSTALLFAYYGRLALGEPIDDLKGSVIHVVK